MDYENNYKNHENIPICYCPNCTNNTCYNVAKLKMKQYVK